MTREIRKHVQKAARGLGSGLVPDSAAVNAVGVFLEPRLRENDLLAARAEIEAALEKIRNAAWPGRFGVPHSRVSVALVGRETRRRVRNATGSAPE